jgi:hypothetical protein
MFEAVPVVSFCPSAILLLMLFLQMLFVSEITDNTAGNDNPIGDEL